MDHPLAKNRVLLVKETPVDEVLKRLVQQLMVTWEEREFISHLDTKEKRAGALLDLLVKRGPDALDAFCQALLYVQREDLVAVLRSDDTEDMDICFPDQSTFHLGGNVYLEVTNNGVTLKKDMQTIYFPVVRWINLRYALDDLDEAVHFLEHNRYASFLKHLGGNVYVRAESPSIYVEFWYNDREPEGISLDCEQYEKLKEVDKVLPTFLPDLNIRLPCEFTHSNIEGALYCSECSPNGPDFE